MLTSGQVLVEGTARPPLPWPRDRRLALARQVQMVFQDPNSSLDPNQTIGASLDEVLLELGGYEAALDGPTSSQRQVIRALIETVVPSSSGHRQYSIDVTWTPTPPNASIILS